MVCETYQIAPYLKFLVIPKQNLHLDFWWLKRHSFDSQYSVLRTIHDLGHHFGLGNCTNIFSTPFAFTLLFMTFKTSGQVRAVFTSCAKSRLTTILSRSKVISAGGGGVMRRLDSTVAGWNKTLTLFRFNFNVKISYLIVFKSRSKLEIW